MSASQGRALVQLWETWGVWATCSLFYPAWTQSRCILFISWWMAQLNLWCGEPDRIQLITSIFQYTVIWHPMVEHSISTRAQKYAKGCLSNTTILAVDGVALFQNPWNLCCDSPTGACYKFHVASFPTTHTSNPTGMLQCPFLLWAQLNAGSRLCYAGHYLQNPKRPARLYASFFLIGDVRGSNLSFNFCPGCPWPWDLLSGWFLNLNRGYFSSSGVCVSYQDPQHTSHLCFLSNQHDAINTTDKCGIQRDVDSPDIFVPYYDREQES